MVDGLRHHESDLKFNGPRNVRRCPCGNEVHRERLQERQLCTSDTQNEGSSVQRTIFLLSSKARPFFSGNQCSRVNAASPK